MPICSERHASVDWFPARTAPRDGTIIRAIFEADGEAVWAPAVAWIDGAWLTSGKTLMWGTMKEWAPQEPRMRAIFGNRF